MNDYVPDFDQLRADMALFIQQIRESAPLADPAMRAELIAAANQFESETPIALQEYLDGMAEAERKEAEAKAIIAECDAEFARLQKMSAEAAVLPASPPLEPFDPVNWESARQRLLNRLRTPQPVKLEDRPDFRDWAYLNESSSVLHATGVPQSPVQTPPPAPAPPTSRRSTSEDDNGWSSWLSGPTGEER